MKTYRNFIYRFLFLPAIVICFGFPSASLAVKKVIDDIDYLYMHIGLQVDYDLPEKLKKETLKFEGNYKRYVSAIYRKDSNDIRFTPKRKGSAVMIIKNKKNKILARLNIDVQKDNLHKIAAELRDLLIAVDGTEVKIYNKKVIVDGQVLLPREMDRINAVVAQYNPNLVQSLVTYSPEAQRKIAEIVEKEIGYPEVTVRYAYNRFLLEGCVGDDDELKRAMSIAELYIQFEVSNVKKESRRAVAIIKNNLTICESEKKEEEKKKEEIKKLIQIVVHFVEMNKSFHKGFLFQWTPSISNQEGTQVTGSLGNRPGGFSGITAVLTATVSNFFPKLNWAKNFQFARVLHNSSILVENGTAGSIVVSSTTPSTVLEDKSQVSGGTVAGVNTNVTPTIIGDRRNLIQMKIGISVSSPGERGATNNRTINTVVNVRDGSSAVIGGVISSFLARNYNRNPSQVEGGSPIVNLYTGKDYNTTKNQFVVFVTPLIKSSASVGVERIKRKFKLDE